MSRIDEIYAAAQKARASKPENDDTPWPWQQWDPVEMVPAEDRGSLDDPDDYWVIGANDPCARFIDITDPQTVMALVEVYRAAAAFRDEHTAGGHHFRKGAGCRHDHAIVAAIEKVEALG